ncbi:putative MFS monocarboxylate transporter [Aspergillus clavatus NRRL 1]|uniref:MFS monocarboxylate transporter, putative n=1 Tax=Aspergillus clavatus (strain ATCC 1007 / CBS 513.65 / DSM 816 / NCTC 3887 / NRRL 1 / QM 1276 / 107) TaxID=344612 RepID=A1CC99_ASPCL|nr:MFS monocarboxylate transporter, putative [Aspergillus clavatus NRRL 1]EAW12156.1 MFS monocarboxylate transporter, putative [Aspergillus clavatus NRRL 1]
MAVSMDKQSATSSPPSTLPVEESDGEKGVAPVQETPSPPPPPNGGMVAWLQVVGAFFLFFNSWGVVNTFGVYQTYYETTLLAGHSPSSISWIGTVQGFLLFVVGVIAGPIFDKGYLKTLVALGSFLVVFGLMMTSLSSQYYQVFLAHGVTVGIGCAFLFLPSIAIVATYFTTRRAVATGITASGGSIGSVIYPIIFRKLIDPLGFGWTTRVIAFIALGGLCLSLAVMRMRLPPPKQTRSLLDLSAFKEAPFLIFSFGLFFAFVGLYFPFFYLPTYMSTAVHSDDDIAFYIIAILNAASVFGRITPGFVADRIGSLNTIIPMGLAAAILAFAWLGIKNIAGTIVFACLYGFASGAIVSLPPTIVAKLSPNMSVVGTRMGMCFTFAGVGLLIGNPIAGTLLDLEHAVFWKAELFCAVLVTTGVACFIWLRLLKWTDGEKGKY